MTQNIAIETSGSKIRGGKGRKCKFYDPDPNNTNNKEFKFFSHGRTNSRGPPMPFLDSLGLFGYASAS